MTWFSVLPHPQRLFRIVTTVLAVAAFPFSASAQSPAKKTKLEDRDAPAVLQAEQMSGRPDRELILERNVELIRGETKIHADRARYRIVEDEIEASGNIRMQRGGDQYTGDELKLRIDAGQGFVSHPTYKLERNNAQGSAARIDFEAEDRAVVTDGTYSTCEGPDPDWYLKSSTLRLDTARDIGTATKPIVYFKGVPILGAPAMSFPLSNARKSGVLPPTIGTTNRGGLELTVPYYFNIAPNRDLTLYPTLISRRGLQLGADARYLNTTYSGQTKLETLFDDKQAGRDRYALSSIHTQSLSKRLSLNWNVNAASDDAYPSDFSRTITTASQRLLLRDANLNYAGDYWSATTRTSNYQVLQDPASPIIRPYDRLPQFTFNAGRQDIGGFDWLAEAELTRFWHPDLVRGNRLVMRPKISYPIIRSGYFVTPNLSLHATKYSLDNERLATGAATSFSRVLPTVSVDSGMVFERNAQLFGNAVTQTLEPRLFYVRTPYRDQSAFPNFDTSEADLSFTQLFSENRFIGNDRVSDANQLTAAVVSRFLEPSGAERIRLAVGQRYYFSEQRVTLGATSNQSRSDLLFSVNGQFTRSLNAEANVQYSESLGSLNRSNFGVRWQPAPLRVLNLQYRKDVPNDLEQVDFSGQWPLAQRWYGVGRVNYSLKDSKVAEGLLGMEYKADCWVFRVVGQRTPTATQTATSAIFVQLELNGLSRLGSNPLQALRDNVPGYQNINQPGPVLP